MLKIITAFATLFAGAAHAQTCGDADTPCEIPGGFYHASIPDGGVTGAVVFLHGYGGRASATVRNTGLMNAMTSQGYAVIAVQGMPARQGSQGGSWNSRALGDGRRDDVAFINAAADDAAQRFDFSRETTVLAGFSGGGMMTWRVACDAPEAFAAYAPIAGTFWNPIPEDCAAPVRIFHTHGTSDTVVPLTGRTVGSGAQQGDVFEVLQNQRALHGCPVNMTAQVETLEQFELQHWTSCTNGGEINLALHSGGHSIPRGWAQMMLGWYETQN